MDEHMRTPGRPARTLASLAAMLSMMLPCLGLSCQSKARGPIITQSRDGRFVVVLHEGVDRALAAPVLERLETNAARIKADLGVSDGTPYTVHLRGTQSEYLSVMRSLIGASYPGSTGYVAGPHRAELLATPDSAQDALHEYAHSLSLSIAPRWYNRPRWLWEALAAYEAGEFFDPRSLPGMSEGRFPTMAELDRDYNSSSHDIYRVGFLIFEFLKETWGMERVREVIRTYGNVHAVLGMEMEVFELAWADWVKGKYLRSE